PNAEQPTKIFYESTVTISLHIVRADHQNDEHLLLFLALQPFFDSHLMALMVIKGLGPALGLYIYSTPAEESDTYSHSQKTFASHLTNLSVRAPAGT
ncbi:hypothetical protein A2U01_0056463, partial [Trifolium medium]|nr:hypothetical protein [Trifolium medium]